jgi:streptogramin lyase
LNGPTAMGIDSTGNVWVVSYNEVLSAFSPAGQPLFASGLTGNGLYESYGLTIDTSGNIWTTNNETPGYNNELGTISEFTSSGQAVSGSPYISDINYPYAIAAASDGSVWVANYGNASVTHLSAGGALILECTSTGSCPSLSFPDAVSLDASNNVWVANEDNHTVTEISAAGVDLGSASCCDEAGGLAIDTSGNVWSANYSNSSISEVSSSRTVISSGYTGGGLDQPDHLAVDGTGTLWVANYHGASFSELAGAGSAVPGAALSPTAGFGTGAGLVEPYGIAVDASGNLWTSNFASGAEETGTVTEFVGIAAPVKTPAIGPATIP